MADKAGGQHVPQQLSNVLWACASLRKQQRPGDIQLLLQALVHPAVLANMGPQQISNSCWALSVLHALPSWQGAVNEQLVHQLLGQQQLRMLVTDGTPQQVSNVVLSLARLATAGFVSLGFAQECANLLLENPLKIMNASGTQDITNALWACAELGTGSSPFVAVSLAWIQQWFPECNAYEIGQLATTCVHMDLDNASVMRCAMSQGQDLLKRQYSIISGRRIPLSESDRTSITVLCSWAVARLGLQQLASPAHGLVVSSKVAGLPRLAPPSLRRLWVFHDWLLQHKLLDGRGLAGVLTEQQLLQGAKEAEEFGDK